MSEDLEGAGSGSVHSGASDYCGFLNEGQRPTLTSCVGWHRAPSGLGEGPGKGTGLAWLLQPPPKLALG